MDSEPYIQHIVQILRRLPPEPIRAVYMVVKEYDTLVSKTEYHIESQLSTFLLQEVAKMCKQMMIKYIRDTLEDLPEDTVSELYWFLKLELDM